MSEMSYQDNVKRQVTGRYNSNCVVAAYDRISVFTGVSTETYVEFEKTRFAYEAEGGDDVNYVSPESVKRFTELKTRFRADLGVYSEKNIVEARVDTQDQLQKTLSRLALGGYRPAVYLDVGGLHAVGVKPVDEEHYDVLSTWTPFYGDGPVHVSSLFEYLDLAPRLHVRPTNGKKTLKQCNIVALPAEKRKRM